VIFLLVAFIKNYHKINVSQYFGLAHMDRKNNSNHPFIKQLAKQPLAIRAKIMSYIEDKDRHALKLSCMSFIGSKNISFRHDFGKAAWDHMKSYSSTFLEVEKWGLEEIYQIFFNCLEPEPDAKEMALNLLNNSFWAGVYLSFGAIGIVPALSCYPIGAFLGAFYFSAGAVQDLHRHFRTPSYTGIFLPLPSKARALPSEKKNTNTENNNILRTNKNS
jgi:hypothetical protein